MFVLILVSVMLGAVAQVLLKIGAGNIGVLSFALPDLLASVWKMATSLYIVTGMIMYAASFLLWIKVLSTTELSYAYPMVSMGYIVVMFLSWWLLGEQLSFYRLLGVALIITGIYFITKS